MDFYKKISPVFGGKKYLIPPPTLCPDCRQQRRLSFHNERKLYKRLCNGTGKDIISIYSPDKSYTVYHQDYWWSDAWDPLKYGREFDVTKSFFDQWKDYSDLIPRQALIAKDCENSEYVNFVWKVKSSYLISAASFDEDCYYGNRVTKSKNCVDTFLIKECENCYECIDAFNSYNCHFSQNIYSCRDGEYLYDCEGCELCFLCAGLKNKKYCIKNISYTPEAYQKEVERYRSMNRDDFHIEKRKFIDGVPKKTSNILNSERIYGNNVKNSYQSKYVFDGDELDSVDYSAFVDYVKDAMDINYGYGNTQLQYESLGTGENSYGIVFSINVWPDISHLLYCDTCTGCHHCFGCVALRNRSYCILNRQYTKEAYESLIPHIIEKMMNDGEWGEFFPASLSPFGYNETVAQEYFPLTKEEALSQRFNWSDYEAPLPKVEKIIPASRLPEDIPEIPDDILAWAIECEVSGKPFRIIKQELEFYRKHSLPIPHRHPDQRHLDRMNKRNPRKLFERKCDNCSKEMISTYAPERPERVYCEVCYERDSELVVIARQNRLIHIRETGEAYITHFDFIHSFTIIDFNDENLPHPYLPRL